MIWSPWLWFLLAFHAPKSHLVLADPMGNGRMVFLWSPWKAGKPLTWDVTVICPLADSYVAAAAREAGSAAEEAATRKTAKYSNIQAHHFFQPVAVESLGPVNASGRVFLSKLGRKLADQSGDDREIRVVEDWMH